MASMTRPTIDIPRHIRYFLYCLRTLPTPYTSLDTNRLTVAYFCVSGLDLLGALDKVDAPALIRWIYSQQLRRPEGAPADEWLGGFRGAFLFGAPFSGESGLPTTSAYDTGHIAMTYTALATLLILGDDLSGVDRAATLRHVRALQQADGSFRAFDGGESDMRFVYCAAAICAMLRDGGGAGEDLGEEGSSLEWEGMDAALASSYVLGSQAYDGALGLGPGMESHGGSTYTGLSALALMGYLPQLQKIDSAIFWCKARQIGGFQGRPNKDEDTCYSFWIGASLHLLGAGSLIDANAVGCFAQCCEFVKGGLAKVPGNHPDVLHSYFALAGLSLTNSQPGLRPLDPRFGMSVRACEAAGLRPWAPAENAARLHGGERLAPPPAACEPCEEEVS